MLEVVLGIDNVVFISILAGKLPAADREKARRVGLSLAMVGSLFALTALRPRTRIATMMAGSVAGFTVARPVGTLMQRYITTLPEVEDICIRSVRRRRFLGRWVIEVQTESNAG